MIAPSSENSDIPETAGGAGAVNEGELLTYSQVTRLERRAMREQWPVPTMTLKQKMVERQVEIAINGQDDRASTAAYNAVLATSIANMQGEPHDDPADEPSELENADARVSDVVSGILLASPTLVAGNGSNGERVDTPRANGKANGVSKP